MSGDRSTATRDEGTVPISLRLQKQLIADLKHIAKIRGLRGYQTLIKQVLAEALAESKPSFEALREVLRITERDHPTWKRAHEELAWLEQRTFP